MATKRKSAKKRRPLSREAARIHAEAEEFAEAFGRLEVGAGVCKDVAAQLAAPQQGGAVHVVLDNTVPGGFRMEPV